MSEPENPMGFKLPNAENWLDPDRVWRVWKRYSQGEMLPHTPEAWIEEVREVNLDICVPFEIKRLFEVARSCIIYGYLCYPLLTLGIEQLYRVVEGATRTRAGQLGCPKKERRDQSAELATFQEAILWLKDKGIIADSEFESWQAVRWLRNYFSHPTEQSILGPGDAIGQLRLAARRINMLFSDVTKTV